MFPQPTSYDEVNYPGESQQCSHPAYTAAIGVVLGMDPPNPATARVMELGCGLGVNLLPMAEQLPEATFLGIDSSAQQIEIASAAAKQLGLSNIRFVCADIREIGPTLGVFDYVIAYGVYSWVAPDVRNALLAACKSCLAPDGIAYISYNTLPGWYDWKPRRDAMLYRTHDIADATERARAARELIELLASAAAGDRSPQAAIALGYADGLRERADGHLLHDELSEFNDPVYFHQFASHAGQHGLQYLAECPFPRVFPGRFAPEVVEGLARISRSLVDDEQYLDFLNNRSFRRTLLCHDAIPLQRSILPSPQRFARLHAMSSAHRESDPDLTFRSADGASLSTASRVAIAGLDILTESPSMAVAFPALLGAARDRATSQNDAEQDAKELAAVLLRGFIQSPDLVNLVAVGHRSSAGLSARPEASRVARYRAANGSSVVTNFRHERVQLTPGHRALLLLLDGTRDLDALEAEWTTRPSPDTKLKDALKDLLEASLLVA